MLNDKSNIIVSICCITYNHAPFIRKALDGFLMQKPPTGVSDEEPWYEILIHDDASTDGTIEIIKEYTEKYPDKIFPLYEKENQYSNGKAKEIDMYNYNRARGKYIAYCEGDDYWTNPLKLQKQVDFMETHPEYSVCFHGNSVFDVCAGKQYLSSAYNRYNIANNKTSMGMDITAVDYFKGDFGQPLTMLFRLSMYDSKWRYLYEYYRDTHEIYHLLCVGKGYWMNFNGGIYNKHMNGISAAITREKQYQVSYVISHELYQVNHDNATRFFYAKTLEWLVNNHIKINNISYALMNIRLFILTGNLKRFIVNIYKELNKFRQ